MSARRAKKPTTRTLNIEPGMVELDGVHLVFMEYRNGVRHVVRVRLGDGETYVALDTARRCRKHVQNVRDGRAQLLAWAQQNLDELGGAK